MGGVPRHWRRINTVRNLETMRKFAIVAVGLAVLALLPSAQAQTMYLWEDFDGREFEVFEARRIHSKNTHGTGCTLSAAITALLARGEHLKESIARAKRYVTRAIETAPGIGGGDGPMNHMWGIEGPPV